jgi:hypothetical protein
MIPDLGNGGRTRVASGLPFDLMSVALACGFRELTAIGIDDGGLEPLLRLALGDPPKQREASAVAVNGEVAGREADVLALSVPALPDGKAFSPSSSPPTK